MNKIKKKIVKKGLKKLTAFRPMIRSRHPSHQPLRKELGFLGFRSVVRFGSTTALPDDVTHGGARVECNTVESIKNSSDKLRMKKCFDQAGATTAPWFHASNQHSVNDEAVHVSGGGVFNFPIVGKHRMGSRGRGNTLIKTKAEYEKWKQGKDLSQYIIESFLDYGREYRLHITKWGCFYTCRKVMKSNTPEEEKWHRHEDNCAWFVDSNPKFDRPVNWKIIEEHCIKALKATGLDFGAFDVKVQTTKTSKGVHRPEPKFILLEVNSAPSFGEGTKQHYQEMLPKILKDKFVNN